ncbi:beta-lactamase/transpeptidase-like protein [Stachybotrys elegans]|uniref:Beta-lactamase/transpeptidase-like protein n=1 Tax=Stachybotrys elegans TaxID=80388 RepID=A0A8K0SWH8_9HYPO|nr:beta-lactamase/transpeptidase-like protein [Stachybotrys elegans]
MRLVTLLPLSLLCSPALADVLGPRYPYPTDISSNSSRVLHSWRDLTAALDAQLAPNSTSELRNVTFSVGIFSLHDPNAAFNPAVQYHYTAPEVANSQYGIRRVNGDAVYRLASITKLITMYAGLLSLDSADWERPLTDFFPQLAEGSTSAGIAQSVQWDKITVMTLASHLGGVPRDAFGASENDIALVAKDPTALGLPPLSPDDPQARAVCNVLEDAACVFELDNYIAGLAPRPPTFLPWTSPGYSNNAYILLGQIFQSITGKEMEELYRDSIFGPLGMSTTTSVVPPESFFPHCVIPGDDLVSFASDLPILRSSGGVLSTLHDLSKMGMAILNNTLLSREETSRWMKPHTHTDRFQVSIGAPWEIFRHQDAATGIVVDMYCKSGDSGVASTWTCLLPDFEVGFNVLGASTSANRTALIGEVADGVVDAIVPSLLHQAALETQARFAGVYESTVEGLNSSLTLAVNTTYGAPPGMTIVSFISNSTSVTELVSPRLVPSIASPRTNQQAFRSINAVDIPSRQLGRLSDLSLLGWVSPGVVTYGNLDIDLFVFELDPAGRATAVNLPGFRASLVRVG